jgi:hypothetical protein
VAQAFLVAVNDPAFRATAAVNGTVTLGSVEMLVSGQMKIAGDESHMAVSVTAPGQPTRTTEMVNAGGRNYQRSDGGLWLMAPEAAEAAEAAGPVTAGLDFTSVREAGTRRVGGSTLVRLEPVGGSSPNPRLFGLTDPSIAGFAGSVEFLATKLGEPAGMTLRGDWSQALDGELVDASMELDILFERIGLWVRIEAPSDAWFIHTSDKLDYSIAMPRGWEATHHPAGDYPAYDMLVGPLRGEVHVIRYDEVSSELTRNHWYQDSAAALEENFGGEVTTWDEGTVGGHPAAIFRTHYETEWGNIFLQQATLLVDGVGWDLNWHSDAGSEEADRRMFEQFLSTFTLGG